VNVQSPESWILFSPPRRKGLALHIGALFLSGTLLVILLTLAITRPPGLAVVFLLLGAFLFSLPIPLLLYRLYTLLQSGYWIGRNGMRLRWGLRLIDLPFAEIVDLARAEELEAPIELPAWSWPGSISGVRQDAELGTLEFLATDKDALVLVGTNDRVFLISPENPLEFVGIYKRESERGSLRPIAARSIAPSFVLVEAWGERRVPALLAAGGGLALALLVLVGLLAPGLQSVSLGFGADGQPLQAVAGVQLFLLPALNLFFYMGNFVLGLLLYREPRGILFSYLLWGASIVTGILFLIAILVSL
jgi:hypothetical protein